MEKLTQIRHSSHRPQRSWPGSDPGHVPEPPRPAEDQAVQIDPITARTQAREHRLFAGKPDKSQLSFAERAVVLAVRGAEGDFRDWDEVAAWATGIAEALQR